ncbi:type 1 glutamine amidotransferase-like domain-containing protein [Candidatus Woesearchaeota archaeon]|nr:type 1 glutamine amidotransferase-like domain-containing protein [Candidatus Woesearchaeota archaeon]
MKGWPIIPEFKEVGVCELDIEDEDFLKKWNWSVHWFHQMQVPNAAVLHTADRDVANSEEFCEHIRKAEGLFFTTGTASKFVATYRGTKAHEEFIALLERGGSIGGWSGGAAIQGAWSADSEVASFIETMGFLPNTAIMTHFLVWNTQFFMPKIIEEHPECLGIGLDEKAAIVVQGDEFEVIGSSYVAIYDYNKVLLPDGKFYLLASGDRFNLSTREVIGEPKTYLKQLVNRKCSEIYDENDSNVMELMRSRSKGE